MTADTILEFQNITKKFPGVLALNQVSLRVERTEVHAIVGENGAGKSTLMKIAAGLYQPDEGQVILKGRPVQLTDAEKALKLGVAMVPQELNLVPELSVAENIFLGMEPRKALGVVDQQKLHRGASEILASVGTSIDTYQKVKRLTVAQQQMVQIARALAYRCEILIMDEPTASLSEREKEALFERMRGLRARGTTIVYISHRLKEIFEISDRITVLRDGQLIKTMDTAAANEDTIVSLMIGRTLSDFLHERVRQKREADVVLEGRNLSVKGQFEDVSFQLHRGEILGFAGLVGAGRSEVFSSVFGHPPLESGQILLDGQPVQIRGPVDAIRLGIGYVPEERKRLGLFLIMSVLHNTTFPFLKRLQRFTIIRQKQEKEEAGLLVQRLRVSTPSLSQQVGLLSGGNQQKVILARWLGSGARILILDEPTRGIDVNAKAEIHALIADLAAQDKSIILISSELQELMGIADRIVVMREGHIAGDVYPDEVTEEDVLRLAMWGANGGRTEAALTGTVDTRPVAG